MTTNTFSIDYAALEKSVAGSPSDFDLSTMEVASSSGTDAFLGRRTPKTASSHRLRVASIDQLKGFMRLSQESLVHMSTQDLWFARREGDELVLERLFDDNGSPLKVLPRETANRQS